MIVGFKIENGILLKYEDSKAVVSIPDGITEIGEYAFAGSDTLVELIMPDSVTHIAQGAFQKCTKLKSVVFSKKLTSIATEAFMGCSALKKIELPKTLRTIEYSAFAGCVKLEKALCESEVYEVGADPFSSIHPGRCEHLYDKDGFLVFANVLYSYIGNADVITVPAGVTHIASSMFPDEYRYWNKVSNCTKIILPDSVKHVEAWAFANCAKLQEIVMPEGVEFEPRAFAGCCKLVDENGMMIIGNTVHAYFGNKTVVEIPEGVEVLADHLFSTDGFLSHQSNKTITRVILPESLKHIGKCAFRGCTSLQEINIPSGVSKIDEGAFYDCTNLTQIKIPETTTVSNLAFYNCKGLADENGFIIIQNSLHQYVGAAKELTVPENVKCIGENAFYGQHIQKLQLPKCLIGLGAAFKECAWLEEIEIPEGITTVPAYTFYECHRLRKVTLPGSVTEIGKYAFEDCEVLEELQIPTGVTQIGDYAFKNCKALKEIRFPAGCKTIPASVCNHCEALESVTVCHGVEVIEHHAFEHCVSLKHLSLPASVKKIGYAAFKQCTGLESIEVANRSCAIAITAFNDCPRLADEAGMKIVAGVLLAYTGEGKTVVIPDTVRRIAPKTFKEGYEWNGNRNYSFRPKGSLQEIEIPGSVKVICEKAFQHCSRLTRVVMADGVEVIYEHAFEDCAALTEVVLPGSLKYLGSRAFAGCRGLTSVIIPQKLEAINLDAFRDCSNLTGIFVEEGNPNYSDVDGILYDAEKTTLIFCPPGKKPTEFTVSENVSAIADHAFIDCTNLQKVVIPATVKEIGSEVFVRRGHASAKFQDIQIAIGAGSAFVGEAVIDFPYGDGPLVYPAIPVSFPAEQATQVRLGLGFCQSPEKYADDYAEVYRKYVKSHRRTLLNKAKRLGLKAVEDYLCPDSQKQAEKAAGYKPDLTIKRPTQLQKVQFLEEVVQKGTLEDLRAVLHTYQTFELMARALGLAARYRGVDFVRVLAEHGATFRYPTDSTLQRKYNTDQKTASGRYCTEYYLMTVFEKLSLPEKDYGYRYEYSPLCGIGYMEITEEQETKTLPLQDRLEVVKFFAEHGQLGVSLDEMLFWALTGGELAFADALMEMGVNLQKTCPDYYQDDYDYDYDAAKGTYIDIITSCPQSVYWSAYVYQMAALKTNQLLPVLERLHRLANAAGKKPVLTQTLFDNLQWSDGALSFALEHLDLSRINKKKTLETAVSQNGIAALSIMAAAGWISQPAKREKLIEFARNNQCHEAFAWLLDYKNRTVDIAAEEAKEQAKMLRELTEAPNSVSVLKRTWSYKKLENGTLQITSYKGSNTEVIVPERIGKASVSSIGKYAFSCAETRAVNRNVREKITSVILPEGITDIGESAFRECCSLARVSLPSTLKTIGAIAFSGCPKLEKIELPQGIRQIGPNVFAGCDKLYTDGFQILGSILFHCKKIDEVVEIPEGVTVIRSGAFPGYNRVAGKLRKIVIPTTVKVIEKEAFTSTGIQTLELPASVQRIEEKAFYQCSKLEEIRLNAGLQSIGESAFSGTAIQSIVIPDTVTELGRGVFYHCPALRDILISDSVTSIDAACFGYGSLNCAIHTTEGAYVVEYLKKNYPKAVVIYDYKKEGGQ